VAGAEAGVPLSISSLADIMFVRSWETIRR